MSQQPDRVVFLGGAPGTGKSTAITELAGRVPDLVFANAGDLIRRGLGRDGAYVRPPVAGAAQARFFQDVLVDEFTAIRVGHRGPIVLDGHYAVPTAQGPVILDPEVFRRLGCTNLVLIETGVADVASRLRARGGTAWWDGSDEALTQLVQAERAGSTEVARTLGVPVVVTAPDNASLKVMELFQRE